MTLRDYFNTQGLEGLSASMIEQLGGEEEGARACSRYFLRKNEYDRASRLKTFQLTYVNSLAYAPQEETGSIKRIGAETYTYSPSPMTNFVVSPIPGRILGEYAITSRLGEFWLNQGKDYSLSLLKDLNSFDFNQGTQSEVHTLAQAARFLFSFEKDNFQDGLALGWKPRQGPLDDLKGGVRGLHVPYRYDEFFMPTLLDTDLFDIERWPYYPRTRHGERLGAYDPYTASEPEKHFFVILTPYRDWTLFMANYPVSSTFGQNRELLSSSLMIDWILWMIEGVAYLMNRKENFETPTDLELTEKHKYWSVVGLTDKTRHPARANGGQAVNLPVIPFEEALTYVESQGTSFGQAISQKSAFAPTERMEPVSEELRLSKAPGVGQATESCTQCGSPRRPQAKFCIKCGSPYTEPVSEELRLSRAPGAGQATESCTQCGSPRRPQAKFCIKCGSPFA